TGIGAALKRHLEYLAESALHRDAGAARIEVGGDEKPLRRTQRSVVDLDGRRPRADRRDVEDVWPGPRVAELVQADSNDDRSHVLKRGDGLFEGEEVSEEVDRTDVAPRPQRERYVVAKPGVWVQVPDGHLEPAGGE